ncbi:MAG TPA: TetR/AcrR family transcriptional regulator [Dehalococcoidia bacterium]|nr:TetR/AcrR family transcriptional regulator [Dehalococcoidia bacterium]
MAKKQREEERRAQILWAAIQCVAELGIEGATMKKIAERAGVSTGMITYYFRSKNDLMKNALAFGHSMVGERSRRLREGNRSREFLPTLFEVSLVDDAPSVPPLSFWIEYWAHASRDSELKDFRAERIARFRQTIAEAVKGGIQAGRYRESLDPLLAADLLQAVLDGLQLKVALDSATVSRSRAMKVVRFLLHLMAVESPPEEQPVAPGTRPNGSTLS